VSEQSGFTPLKTTLSKAFEDSGAKKDLKQLYAIVMSSNTFSQDFSMAKLVLGIQIFS
jgi:hypothetical protein